ncbi:MAG: hypothetical protein DI549_18420 [Ancylobacter novellus]|uniref:Uncharacterized protein n=1 Tax=Ancylobacter novellus TaxID=921 RepID=A0A2W5QSK3_ANCNO|nr:MAG: hypothetical protein DI549_18420 [Ancylobacter novellus]
MPRLRKPRAVAQVTGAAIKNPARYRDSDPGASLGPLGEPPAWLPEGDASKAQTAWREISGLAPWMNRSHRGLTSIAATVLGRIMARQEVGVQALNLLRQCLGSMGLTPADAHKVARPPAATDDDPASQYFT